MRRKVSCRVLVQDRGSAPDLVRYLNTMGFNADLADSDHPDRSVKLRAHDIYIVGLEMLDMIRGYDSRVPVVVLSEDGTDDMEQAYAYGADDYIKIPFSYKELALRLGALVRRADIRLEAPLGRYNIGNYIYIPRSRTLVFVDAATDITLTKLEGLVLEALCMYTGNILPGDLLTKHVYKDATAENRRRLDNIVSHLRKHFKGDPRIAIEPVRGVGYILSVDDKKKSGA